MRYNFSSYLPQFILPSFTNVPVYMDIWTQIWKISICHTSEIQIKDERLFNMMLLNLKWSSIWVKVTHWQTFFLLFELIWSKQIRSVWIRRSEKMSSHRRLTFFDAKTRALQVINQSRQCVCHRNVCSHSKMPWENQKISDILSFCMSEKRKRGGGEGAYWSSLQRGTG